MRILALAVASFAAPAGLAEAAGPFDALPPAQRAPSSVASWPTAEAHAIRDGGSRLSIRARRPGRAALVRVTRSGSPVRTVKARSLKPGQRLSVVLPMRLDTLYALSLTVRSGERSRRYRTWIQVPARVPAPPPLPPAPLAPGPPPPPALAPAPQERCGTSAPPVATLTAEHATYAPGEWVAATLTNRGAACLGHGEDLAWERATDSGWAPHGTPGAFPAIGYILEPGEARTVRGQVPCDAPPGRYRMVKRVDSSGPGPASEATVAAEIDVAAGSCP